MPIYFTHDGARLDVDDIPLAVFADIKDKTGIEWWQVAANPMRYAGAGELLAKACADITGVKLPEVITAGNFTKLFTVDEAVKNLPDEFNDGIPDPKAGDEPATTSSSGSPE
jgi:hypothetical protein